MTSEAAVLARTVPAVVQLLTNVVERALVPFTQDEQAVQAFPAGGADPALRHHVRTRRPVG